mgnify:CR=1 FL=1
MMGSITRSPSRVLVLTGTDPAFCAGLDLKSFSAPDAPRGEVAANEVTNTPRGLTSGRHSHSPPPGPAAPLPRNWRMKTG